MRNLVEVAAACPLTVKLRGRTEAPALAAEGAEFPNARGANQEAHHGPLQRLLDSIADGVEPTCLSKRRTGVWSCAVSA